MSQTTPETGNEMTPKEFAASLKKAKEARLKSGLRHGPCYSTPESAPLVWFDQVFERGLTPAGTVACEKALRVGATQNGLDIILVASHDNVTALTAASGATITATLMQADEIDGEYSEVGPTICVKAPKEGISADQDHLLARFAIGNFAKPWLKVKLTFEGTITGGKLDCALSYVAR